MSKLKKLIEKARATPDNLRFTEFCSLCRELGMKSRKKKGSHRIYKREETPIFTLPIQDYNGMAKPYQVKQLLNKVKEHGLYDFGEED